MSSSRKLRKRPRRIVSESSDSSSQEVDDKYHGYEKDSFVASESEEPVSEVETVRFTEEVFDNGVKEKLEEIVGVINKNAPSFTKVVNGPFSLEEKANLLLEMAVYSNLVDHTVEKLEFRKKLVMKLQGGNPEILQKINALRCSNKEKRFLLSLYKANMEKLDPEKLTAWLNSVLELPWQKKFQPTIDMSNVGECYSALKQKLDEKVYGLQSVKEQLLQFFFTRLLNPTSQNKTFLTLVGPPGVGKSTILHCITEVIGIPLAHISMGSITTKEVLKGSSSCWVGSDKGIVANSLKNCGVYNPILFFDEIDKTVKEVHQSFLEIADPISNKDFRDAFIPEIPIDLSQAWIVFACNNIDDVDPVLRDRLHCIHIPDYSVKDKITILLKHILPSTLKDNGLAPDAVTLSSELAEKWVRCMTKRSNIRPLASEVISVVQKVKLLIALGEHASMVSYYIPNLFLPTNLTEKQLEKLREKQLSIPETQLSMYT